nr:proline--tRNA ligase [Campylobacter sp.]
IKAIIKKAIFEDESKIIVFFIRGDDELQEAKAKNACGALELEDASIDEVQNAGLVAGFCGPVGLPENVDFYIDKELENNSEMICGANEKDYHIIGFKVVNFKNDRFKDLVAVKAGDKAIDGGILSLSKGIEVGHIFQLGQKYSQAMNATFLDENGKAVPFFMGCYGIGVSRLLAVMVEANHDEKGCIWNKECSPFAVHIIISNIKDESQMQIATKLEQDLENLGIEVLVDDRNERFGSKMADFELIGVPFGVLIGKSLEQGEVELIKRADLSKIKVKKDKIFDKLKELI